MYHQSKLLLLSTSVIAALSAVSLGFQAGNAGTEPTPTPSLEQKISKLEDKISQLEKKVEVRPKDTWDKLTAISGVISGILIAVIGAIVTVFFKRRENAFLEAQGKKEDEDRKAKLELEQLGNKRAETQLEIERQSKEREIAFSEKEIAISQAQTVQNLLPSLQSTDGKTKETALMLIAFLGNPDLAAKLSSLYQTDLTPTLKAIVSMPGLKLDQKRQAAAALGYLGDKDGANNLLELSTQPTATIEERFLIAQELEALGDKDKAAKVQLELVVDPQVDSEKRHDAVEALKRLDHIAQAKEELLRTAGNNQFTINKRIAAMDALWQLDETQKTVEEWIPILMDMISSSAVDPKELPAAISALRRFGQPEKAAEVVKVIADDSQRSAKLRLVAANDLLEQGYIEHALKTLREIIDSQEATTTERLQAVALLGEWGSPEEAKEKKQKIVQEMASNTLKAVKKWWQRKKPSSAASAEGRESPSA